jgi:hypothetical protein
MSTKPLTLTVPDSLAQELDSASQEFLVEILERGLREIGQSSLRNLYLPSLTKLNPNLTSICLTCLQTFDFQEDHQKLKDE